MSEIISYTDSEVIKNMPEVEASNSAAQMMALLAAIVQEKSDIESMVTMLENQPWYKRCIMTVLGKNKATVNDIQQHRDKIAAYTSNAVALLFQNSRIQQNQIISLGESVNMINGLLASTNEQILETQKSMISLKNEILYSINNLANTINQKIESIDSFHLLITEIGQGKYTTSNQMVGMFSVLSQIDHRVVADQRKLEAITNALVINKVLDLGEHTLAEYLKMIACLPDKLTGIVYQELFCFDNNEITELFSQVLERYSFFSPIMKKAKKSDAIIDTICNESELDCSVCYSAIELFQYFLELKKQYLSNVAVLQSRDALSSEGSFSNINLDTEGTNENDNIVNDFLELESDFYVEDTNMESYNSEKIKIIEEFEANLGCSIDQIQESLFDLAFKDRLTTLPNFNLFYSHVQNYIKEQDHFVIMDMDLDNLKSFNDNYGQKGGDEVIIDIAEKLSNAFRDRFQVYRIGGDEFAIIFPFKGSEKDIIYFINLIKRCISKPIETSVGSFHSQFSYGISGFPHDGNSPDQLLLSARTAMYNAKMMGKNRFCFYSQSTFD